MMSLCSPCVFLKLILWFWSPDLEIWGCDARGLVAVLRFGFTGTRLRVWSIMIRCITMIVFNQSYSFINCFNVEAEQIEV